MFLTSRGMIAISTPEGFTAAEGPMEVLFVPQGKRFGESDVFIYVGSVALGKGTQFKDLDSFIRFDVEEFRMRFPTGSAKQETPAGKGGKLPVWTFRSGESKNGFERLVFVADSARSAWLLVLSATSQQAFDRTVPAFEKFVAGYKGSIHVGKR